MGLLFLSVSPSQRIRGGIWVRVANVLVEHAVVVLVQLQARSDCGLDSGYSSRLFSLTLNCLLLA